MSLPDGELLANLDVRAPGVDTDVDRFEWFRNKVAKEIGRHLYNNAEHPAAPENDVDSYLDVYETVLAPDNVREVVVRDKPLSDTRVTVWLRDCPIWANDAWNEKLVDTSGRNDCHVVIDVRPF